MKTLREIDTYIQAEDELVELKKLREEEKRVEDFLIECRKLNLGKVVLKFNNLTMFTTPNFILPSHERVLASLIGAEYDVLVDSHNKSFAEIILPKKD